MAHPERVLVVGATGALGSLIAARLANAGAPTRAMLRPDRATGSLEADGIEIVRGDLRDSSSVDAAVQGVSTIITTANTIGRRLGGERSLDMRAVDQVGNANLVAAAERAGVERFVFLSLGGPALHAACPFTDAKRQTEARLGASPMRTVIVRPDAYQEVFLSEKVGFDPAAGRVMIFGRGRSRVAYTGIADVAEATVALALHADPPAVVELGGPDAITRLEAVEAFERALGRSIRRRHIPRGAMQIGSRLLRRVRPELASSMAMSLAMDETDSGLGPAAFVALGIAPLSVMSYIERRSDEIARRAHAERP